MKINKAVLRITTGLLCAVLIFNTLPLSAASSVELRHEAFMRGGKAITAALSEPSKPAASKTVAEAVPPLPSTEPAPAPVPAPRASTSSGLSKPLWIALIGGFAVSGFLVYHYANTYGASVRNCSTCSK
jgi:hypothetical protein